MRETSPSHGAHVHDQHLHHELQTLCRRYHAVLLGMDAQTVTVALHGTVSSELVTALRFASNRRLLTEQWPRAKLELRLSPADNAPAGNTPERAASEADAHEDDAPVSRFINRTLRLAFQRRASDIHFEPGAGRYRVRMRIDGVLQESAAPNVEWAARITARLKIMGQLNIAERRLPQDGQFSFTLDNHSYSLRIATLPVHGGEKVVLRILQTYQQELALETLGLSPSALACLMQALRQPQGMILVTGPTGSGKTVTLYSAIRWLNDAQRNICSVEDPIEIPLAGINQTAVNLNAQLDFSRILRALLRQDPDIIMVGEIRDGETAEIAVKAAQTGHLVLSTLHTNSAPDALVRLGHLGIPDYLLAATLKLIVAQRLVRRLCPHCKRPAAAPLTFPRHIWPEALNHWEAAGCAHCFSGYYGRSALYELLPLTPPIQQALNRHADMRLLEALAHNAGYTTLFSAGLHLVAQGITSMAEVYRVVGVSSSTHTSVTPEP